ncbi:ABC transporter, ATP-binding protein [Selenomonas sp. oral taxon 137 str. F0430]|uniref:ABC transporter ATP-binding protein n=1 Tax=Selenomonas sp. oral taxon 137 TaxID=712531 RepID=UPI0001EB243B|nr:ABC transporter, ATP-binding protein [Selenomonas sp. oral taxon 137 str. F0430]
MRTKPSINTTYVYLAHKGSIIIIVFHLKSNITAHNIIDISPILWYNMMSNIGEGGEIVLRIESVSFDYETTGASVRVLADASLHVARSEVHALIGASGCGKSTLLRLAAGLLHPTAGTVLMDGAPVDPGHRRIGFLPQNYGLLPWKTVRENILLGAEIKGRARESLADALEELAAELGLTDLLRRYPRELSGGQQQRVGLARVFLLAPDLLLMDEPFSALDAITRESMQEVFLSLWQKRAVTTLLVTHYVDEALALASRVSVMGGRPGSIIETIAHPFADDLTRRTSREFFEMGRLLRAKIAEAGA